MNEQILQKIKQDEVLWHGNSLSQRHRNYSAIITSQLSVFQWHEVIGEEPIAYSILDRIVHVAYRLELKGESPQKRQRNIFNKKLENSLKIYKFVQRQFRQKMRVKMARYLITIFLVLSITTLCPGQKRQISPQYPGGVSELKKDLYYNLKRSSGTSNTAHPISFRLNFSVDKRGKAFNAQISGIKNPDLEKRVAKAVKKLSRFKPGSANGEKIRCDMSIEIKLKK